MEDAEIVALYWKRDETAIEETQRKYGAYCYSIAWNLLSVPEDAEECVNDTWHQVWQQIPPQRPARLRPWLGAIVRNRAISLWRSLHAQKRASELEVLLSELEDSVPSPHTVESHMDAADLGEAISRWLAALPRQDRILFVRRYWYGIPLQTLAEQQHMAPSKLAQTMFRLRRSLKAALEQEGITL